MSERDDRPDVSELPDHDPTANALQRAVAQQHPEGSLDDLTQDLETLNEVLDEGAVELATRIAAIETWADVLEDSSEALRMDPTVAAARAALTRAAADQEGEGGDE